MRKGIWILLLGAPSEPNVHIKYKIAFLVLMAIGVSIDLHTGLFLLSLRLGNQECSHMSYIPAPYDSCGMYNISPFASDRKWESEAFANSVSPFAHRNYPSLQITSPPHLLPQLLSS